MSEGAQNPSSLGETARCERQAFEADHRVAAPIGEPVVAGDNRSNLVSCRGRANLILATSCRLNYELVRRKHKFGADFLLESGHGHLQQCLAPLNR